MQILIWMKTRELTVISLSGTLTSPSESQGLLFSFPMKHSETFSRNIDDSLRSRYSKASFVAFGVLVLFIRRPKDAENVSNKRTMC